MDHIQAQDIADRTYARLESTGELEEFCAVVRRSELDTDNNLLDKASFLILQRFETTQTQSEDTISSHQGATSHLP